MTMDKLRQFHNAAMSEYDYGQAQTIFTMQIWVREMGTQVYQRFPLSKLAMQRWLSMNMDKLRQFHNAAMGENDYGQDQTISQCSDG